MHKEEDLSQFTMIDKSLNAREPRRGLSQRMELERPGDKMGPEKLKKASDLNINIINEQDFLSMIK